jgi:hypothetical protein
MKRSPVFTAFLQVAGVVVYILIFTLTVNYASGFLSDSEPYSQVMNMSFFLLAFVTSALICGSLVLGYPIYLLLGNEKRKAVTIVLWSAVWFVVILLLVAAGIFLAQDATRYVILGI